MKKLLAILMVSFMLFGCTILPDGTVIPDIMLLEDSSAIVAMGIATQARKHNLNLSVILDNITHIKHQVIRWQISIPMDVLELYAAFGDRVPAEYQPVAQLALILMKSRLEPIINSNLPDAMKNEKIKETAIAILTGIETGLRLHLLNQRPVNLRELV